MIHIHKHFITESERGLLQKELGIYYRAQLAREGAPYLNDIDTALGFNANSLDASLWAHDKPIIPYNDQLEHNQALRLLYEIYKKTQAVLEDTYQTKFRLVNAMLQKMKINSYNPMHTDDQPGYDDPVHTCLLYLSGQHLDFEGGELYFQAEAQTVVPERDMLVYFQGDTSRPHEVKPVWSGTRENIIFQFTTNL